MKISYAKTVYGKKEINAVIKCLNESTQFGKYSRKFEEKIAKIFNKKYCLYVNSGSSALLLALESLNFKKNSEIITPALTFSTTVSSIVKANLIPVFLDVGRNTYCIDVSKIEKMITNKTKAILAPNLMGNICEWDKIRKIANKYNLLLIEDSADTLGAKLKKRSVGVYTDISITSFYGSHIINCAGNGGAVCFNDQKYYKKAKLLRSWGRRSSLDDQNSEKIQNRFNTKLDGIDYDSKFIFDEIGYNLEGNEIGAAFGLEQLKSLTKNISSRQKNFLTMQKYFKNKKEFITPLENKNSSTAWLAYPILISQKASFNRKEFQIFLEKNLVQTRVVFTGNIIRQPGFKKIKRIEDPSGFKNSNRIMKNALLLPVHHAMTKKNYDFLFGLINQFLESKNK